MLRNQRKILNKAIKIDTKRLRFIASHKLGLLRLLPQAANKHRSIMIYSSTLLRGHVHIILAKLSPALTKPL